MSSAKIIAVTLVIFSLNAPLKAEGVPFTESGSLTSVPGAGTPGVDTQAALIAQLKQRAVVNWLQSHLKTKFPSYEKYITPDLGERFTLDYRVGRQAKDKTQIEISGTVDSTGLKRWITLVDTRHRGNVPLAGALVMSSSVPGFTFAAIETSERVKDTALGQALSSGTTTILQKFNGKLSTTDLSVGLSAPPRNDREAEDLKDALEKRSLGLALWFHLSPCKSCGGFRLDTLAYNAISGKRVLARSDDLSLTTADLGNAPKMKAVLKTPLTEVQLELEDAISAGKLSTTRYVISVEGIDSYGAYKGLEAALSGLDYLVQVTPLAAQPSNLQFEVQSSLDLQEITQRITQEAFTGFRLKPVRVDSRTLVVRYSK